MSLQVSPAPRAEELAHESPGAVVVERLDRCLGHPEGHVHRRVTVAQTELGAQAGVLPDAEHVTAASRVHGDCSHLADLVANGLRRDTEGREELAAGVRQPARKALFASRHQDGEQGELRDQK